MAALSKLWLGSMGWRRAGIDERLMSERGGVMGARNGGGSSHLGVELDYGDFYHGAHGGLLFDLTTYAGILFVLDVVVGWKLHLISTWLPVISG